MDDCSMIFVKANYMEQRIGSFYYRIYISKQNGKTMIVSNDKSAQYNLPKWMELA